MSFLLILPNQLFSVNYFPYKPKIVILYEHPQYFTKYKFNKKKLVMHRASMKMYEDMLIKKGFKVNYKDFNFKEKDLALKNCKMFDPIDNLSLVNKVNEVFESPNFLLTR
jgi:deoxyribodipyrimidine photolyase-related protein